MQVNPLPVFLLQMPFCNCTCMLACVHLQTPEVCGLHGRCSLPSLWAGQNLFLLSVFQQFTLDLQGPYVLVMVATGQHQKSNKLPAMWLISAYRNLSRPFRKNVRYILLVRPTGGLKALVTCIRPFVSAKAAKKVRKVSKLLTGLTSCSKCLWCIPQEHTASSQSQRLHLQS